MAFRTSLLKCRGERHLQRVADVSTHLSLHRKQPNRSTRAVTPPPQSPSCYLNTGGGTRTLTTVRPSDFESDASTNSATPAQRRLVYRSPPLPSSRNYLNAWSSGHAPSRNEPPTKKPGGITARLKNFNYGGTRNNPRAKPLRGEPSSACEVGCIGYPLNVVPL